MKNRLLLQFFTCLALTILTGCNRHENDILKFNTNDNSLEIGIYKSTILLVEDEDKVKRVGARGYRKMDGATDISLFGFVCGETGGIYSELTVDRNDKDGFVAFDSDTWRTNGDSLVDNLGQKICDIGLQTVSKP